MNIAITERLDQITATASGMVGVAIDEVRETSKNDFANLMRMLFYGFSEDRFYLISGCAVTHLGHEINDPAETQEEMVKRLTADGTDPSFNEDAQTASTLIQHNPSFFAEEVAPVIIFGFFFNDFLKELNLKDELIAEDVCPAEHYEIWEEMTIESAIQRYIFYRAHCRREGHPCPSFKLKED